jgi:hypothetical protein
MSAQIIQFPHVLEAEHRMQIREEATERVIAQIRKMVDNHDGYKVDLFLKLIDQIIDGHNLEQDTLDELLVLRYVISQYCIM